MAGRNLFQYKNQARQYTRWVWFNASTAISAGYGVCYDRDYGTATAVDQARDSYVNLPDNTNNNGFAGVVAESWTAKNDGMGGQMIRIYEPGSVCLVECVDSSVTIGDYLTCIAGGANAGKFTTKAGFLGRGTARALQTISAAGPILVELLDGEESGLVEILEPADGAFTAMVGGVTRFYPAKTLSSDMTYTMPDGKVFGQRKAFLCDAAITTKDVIITVNGVQANDSTVLFTAAMDAAGEGIYLTWYGNDWKLDHAMGGVTLTAS